MESSFGVQIIWILSGQEAITAHFEYIEIEHILNALLKFAELDRNTLAGMAQMPDIANELGEEQKNLINILNSYGITVSEKSKVLRRYLRKEMGIGKFPSSGRARIHRSKTAREAFIKAEEYGKNEKLKYWTTIHLLKVLIDFPSLLITKVINDIGIIIKPLEQKAYPVIKIEEQRKKEKILHEKLTLPYIITKLRELRMELLAKIVGQDHAIETFIEGLYNAELISHADTERKRPLALFVFAGPPGVGKTYLAESSVSILGRPYKRFDMTSYSDHQQHNQLIGFDQTYKGAQPGTLTGFVMENPNGILLFDEIEKAHLNTIQLFYQILDAGRLEDNYLKKDVSFKDTIIIFTTNAGKTLYDNPNKIGIGAANSNYHKRTILNALAQEKNPSNGQPAFPQAICSRLGQGYPMMFNHLGINELEKLSEQAITRTEKLLEKEYEKKFTHDQLIPISLILKEGGLVDARQLKGESEKFIKTELFKFCSLYEKENLEGVLTEFDEVMLEIDNTNISGELQELYEPSEKPRILLTGNRELNNLYTKYIPEIKWFTADSEEEVTDILSTEDVNMVLLDLWIKEEANMEEPEIPGIKTINQGQDYIPLSAKDLDKGRNILTKIHSRFPEIPIYLLSFNINNNEENQQDEYEEATQVITIDMSNGDWDIGKKPEYKAIDNELFLACVRAGGARGLVATDFYDISAGREWLLRRNQFTATLKEINRKIYREKKAKLLAREHKALNFDTVALLEKETRKLRIKMRNFRLSRAIDASDAGEMVDDIERPSIKFEDVIGAKTAKESLGFITDWLKNPKYYRSLGVRPPKGILLTGPPGTGKTMLARALAGESKCAFLETSATSFVTIWQGSGPQNIRNLFARARKYAPTIIFIDEIDAIGLKRGGSQGAGRAEEATLNALLTEMDGFGAINDPPVIVLSATNLVEQLDPALKRRFDREIEVDRPDKEGRLQYLERSLSRRKISKVPKEVIERIAGQSAGMSIADLERILHEAAVTAVRKGTELTGELLEEAFEKIRMGESKSMPDLKTLKRIARHEAGHTVMAWHGGNIPVQVTIVGRGGAGGFMEREAEETRILYTKTELEQRIRESMGGRGAEIIYYGNEEGLSTGVSGDLRNATHIAKMMVQEYGMSEEFGLIAIDKNLLRDGPIAGEVSKAAEKIVKKELKKTIKILEENRKYLDSISEKLLEKNRLTKEELMEILTFSI